MTDTVSAADANRHFSAILRQVREGRSYVVTSHGRPIAKIVPASESDTITASAKETLLKRLADQPISKTGGWTRDDLYEG